MQQRELGRSGLKVAPLAFGGNVFGWTADKGTSFALLDAFVDSGFNLIDTADVYSRWVPGHTGGESETIIGEWLAASGKRDKVLIATKVGKDMGGDNIGLSRRWIRQSVEDSLRRLRTDKVELLQVHNLRNMADAMPYARELKAQGKTKYIGITHYLESGHADTVRLMRAEKPDFVQINYSVNAPQAAHGFFAVPKVIE